MSNRKKVITRAKVNLDVPQDLSTIEDFSLAMGELMLVAELHLCDMGHEIFKLTNTANHIEQSISRFLFEGEENKLSTTYREFKCLLTILTSLNELHFKYRSIVRLNDLASV